MSPNPNFSDDWATLGPPKRKVVDQPPPQAIRTTVAPAEEWAETFDEGHRAAFFTVMGRGVTDRSEFFSQFRGGEVGVVRFRRSHIRDWQTRGPLAALQEAVEYSPVSESAKDLMPSWWPPPTSIWSLLWGLAVTPDFVVEDPLRGLVDSRYSLLHDFYRALWEVRFSIQEQSDLLQSAQLIEAIGAWLTGQHLNDAYIGHLTRLGIKRKVGADQEKIDLLCFLLTLGAQNGLLSRLYVAFDGVERADRAQLKELMSVLQGCSRWSKVPGMPLGILLGWNGDLAGLGRPNSKLAALMATGAA